MQWYKIKPNNICNEEKYSYKKEWCKPTAHLLCVTLSSMCMPNIQNLAFCMNATMNSRHKLFEMHWMFEEDNIDNEHYMIFEKVLTICPSVRLCISGLQSPQCSRWECNFLHARMNSFLKCYDMESMKQIPAVKNIHRLSVISNEVNMRVSMHRI